MRDWFVFSFVVTDSISGTFFVESDSTWAKCFAQLVAKAKIVSDKVSFHIAEVGFEFDVKTAGFMCQLNTEQALELDGDGNYLELVVSDSLSRQALKKVVSDFASFGDVQAFVVGMKNSFWF